MTSVDQLASVGVHVDAFLALRLQCQVMHVLARTLYVAGHCGNADLVDMMCGCGVVRSVQRFLECAIDCMRSAARARQLSTFAREHRIIVDATRSIWRALLTSRNEMVMSELVDVGLLRKAIEVWLPSTISLPIHSTDADFNPLVVRNEALEMIGSLLSHCRLVQAMQQRSAMASNSSSSGDVSYYSALQRALVEAAGAAVLCGTVRREVATLCAQSAKAGAQNSRKTAADVLCQFALLTTISAELDQQFMVN